MTLTNVSFNSKDDEHFITFVTEHLGKGAAIVRGISEDDYIQLAREQWRKCEPDQVYAIKLLIDPITQPELAEGVSDLLIAAGKPFLLLIARIATDGSLVDAPEGYRPPSSPDVALAQIPAASPSGGEVPNADAPADYLVTFLDVLGFEAMLEDVGLEEVHRRYRHLLSVALTPYSESRPWSKAVTFVRGQPVPGLMWLPIQTAYFSDSLLLWCHYRPSHVSQFLERCSQVFCESLLLGIALRGAISVGRAVMDKPAGVYLGRPLVEAVRLEEKSDWVGVALGSSWKSNDLRVPVPPDKVHIYDAPLKEGGGPLYSGMVLDWVRTWRETRAGNLTGVLSGLISRKMSPSVQAKYERAMNFVEFSTQNADWDLPPGWTRITVRSPTKESGGPAEPAAD